MAKSLMLVGTSSNVGKSVLAAAFCRIFYRDGHRVAPFKAQNMSLNSAVTPSGREIGRAQAVQAEACGISPNEHMNPVLLKPTGHMASQVIVQGRPAATREAKAYFQDDKADLWQAVVESFRYLAIRHEIVVIEGAGSPVEMNLKHRDIANMRTAEMANASVILVADIDRGGVFASVVGTIELLEPHERSRVKGILINKFRGDASLFEEGRRWLENKVGIPVLGVIPYIRDLGIEEEDSVGIQSDRYQHTRDEEADSASDKIRIAIVQLPHISNFTDVDPLFLEPDVHPYFCDSPANLVAADVIILPGTKSTVFDLDWLHAEGWADAIQSCVRRGARILGICGGYQMLGREVRDPDGIESDVRSCPGLGLLPVNTVIQSVKKTVLVEGKLCGVYQGISVEGYEIHMGETGIEMDVVNARSKAEVHDTMVSFARLRHYDDSHIYEDGWVSGDGRIIGTYLHGLLHNDAFRGAWLNSIRIEKGLPEPTLRPSASQTRAEAYDRLADVIRQHVDIDLVYAHCLGE